MENVILETFGESPDTVGHFLIPQLIYLHTTACGLSRSTTQFWYLDGHKTDRAFVRIRSLWLAL